jgi:uncharacterized membrane protein (DUF4010 family)
MTELNLLLDWFPREGYKLLLALFLGFLLGLEREERVGGDAGRGFGGVRTFPLLALIGYALALLAGTEIWPVALGLIAVSGFLLLSYWHKLTTLPAPGITSEVSALATYLIGALVAHDQYWVATTLCVLSMLLLELKVALEGLARRIGAEDIFTFTKFLLLTAVILPIVPDHEYTPFAINPFKTWLVVVAVSAISYASYVVQKLTKGRSSVLLLAFLGGAYSSTLTTVVLARRAARDSRVHTISGAILVASGVMYVRLAVLLAIFNQALMRRLAPTFAALAVAAIGIGWTWSRRDAAITPAPGSEAEPSNPLEIRAALAFALLFVAMLIAGHLASEYLGRSGIYALAAVMGVADVDPFILSMTQSAGGANAYPVAAAGILIAAASNNLVKGMYAFSLAPRATGLPSLMLLGALAIAGIVPVFF